MAGIKVHKLGSPQDRVLRQYLVKENEKEISKTQLMAMLVTNSIPFNNANDAREWNSKVKQVFSTFMSLEYGVELPEFSDKETQMIEQYTKKVKHLKPKLTKDKKGGFVVTGLDSLKD